MSTERKISRRIWLSSAAVLTATAGASSLVPYSSSAEGKVSKSTAQYQDDPKAMQMCGTCKYFITASGRKGGMMGGGMMGGGMMGWDDGWRNGTGNDGSGNVPSCGGPN